MDDKRESLRIKLDCMEKQFQWWIDFNTGAYKKEGMTATDDTVLMTPPEWPSHGVLKAWVALMKEAREAV